jgi:hypothetical protein
VRRWLLRHNLKAPELVLENGSGLSRRERISAGSLARLLVAADKSGVREEFASSLAVAATDGTVERRFQDGTVAGQALLKTGTLEGVRAPPAAADREGRRRRGAIINDRARCARNERSTTWSKGSRRRRVGGAVTLTPAGRSRDGSSRTAGSRESPGRAPDRRAPR